MEKITRDTFLYLPPKRGVEDDFAQCGPCRMFVPNEYLPRGWKSGRCIIHGSKVEVDDDDSCGFMVPWPTSNGSPVEHVIKDHAAELAKNIPGSVTTKQSGFVSRRVQCHRCRFAKNKATECGLYQEHNEKMPDKYDLDTNIEPHACCNAQQPRDGRGILG